MQVGDEAPTFVLHDVDGSKHGPDGLTVVIFTCNHCPYALAWHDRTVAVAQDYAERGVKVLLINPNDASRYPADSPEAMKQRVEGEGGWDVPYLRDESQEVARALGSERTPEVFVLDGEQRLAYHGAPDGDHTDPSQDAAWLRAALDAVLDGREVERAETPARGCSVKWRN
jgi:hypothetical protein